MLLEGMALGKTIITTTLGLEGIPAQNGKEVLIADTAEEFMQAISQCNRNREMIRRIGANAKMFIHDHFDSLEIAQKLLDSYRYITSDSYSHHH